MSPPGSGQILPEIVAARHSVRPLVCFPCEAVRIENGLVEPDEFQMPAAVGILSDAVIRIPPHMEEDRLVVVDGNKCQPDVTVRKRDKTRSHEGGNHRFGPIAIAVSNVAQSRIVKSKVGIFDLQPGRSVELQVVRDLCELEIRAVPRSNLSFVQHAQV